MQYINVDDVKVGSVLQLVWVKRYQHGATMRVTKVNKRTFIAEEVKGSYGGPCEVGHPVYKQGRPATEWRIHKDSQFVVLKDYDNEDKSWSDRYLRYYPTY